MSGSNDRDGKGVVELSWDCSYDDRRDNHASILINVGRGLVEMFSRGTFKQFEKAYDGKLTRDDSDEQTMSVTLPEGVYLAGRYMPGVSAWDSCYGELYWSDWIGGLRVCLPMTGMRIEEAEPIIVERSDRSIAFVTTEEMFHLFRRTPVTLDAQEVVIKSRPALDRAEEEMPLRVDVSIGELTGLVVQRRAARWPQSTIDVLVERVALDGVMTENPFLAGLCALHQEGRLAYDEFYAPFQLHYDWDTLYEIPRGWFRSCVRKDAMTKDGLMKRAPAHVTVISADAYLVRDGDEVTLVFQHFESGMRKVDRIRDVGKALQETQDRLVAEMIEQRLRAGDWIG